jgi:hypothetical protein
MNMFNQNYRKAYNNPYRQGVLIGNYSEDQFGLDQKDKFIRDEQNRKERISETIDKYRWPQPKEQHVITPGNELTLKCNNNFDLNIDFTTKNAEDYLKLQEKLNMDYQLNDKNIFLPSEIIAEKKTKRLDETYSGNNGLKDTIQDRLKIFHQYDTNGVLYSKKSGLVKNLFFGHSMEQKKFNDCEYASLYKYIII